MNHLDLCLKLNIIAFTIVGGVTALNPSAAMAILGETPSGHFVRLAGIALLSVAMFLYGVEFPASLTKERVKKTGVRVTIFAHFAMAALCWRAVQMGYVNLANVCYANVALALYATYAVYGSMISVPSLPAIGQHHDVDVDSDRPATRSVTGTPRRRPARISTSEDATRSKSPARSRSPRRTPRRK